MNDTDQTWDAAAVDAETPTVLRSNYERQLDRLLKAIEAGGSWPPSGSADDALLKRAMRPNPVDRKEWVVARVARCRPDKLVRSRADRERRIEAHIAAIEAGGAWPERGSGDAEALADYITPGHRNFRQDVYDRIGDKRRPRSAQRASRAEVDQACRRILADIERTGLVPRATDPDGRQLRSWLRPSDLRFRSEVWKRLEQHHPQLLDQSALHAERERIESVVAEIEAGEPWPPRRSPEGVRLARVLEPAGFFHDPELVRRLTAVAPSEVAAMLKARKRP